MKRLATFAALALLVLSSSAEVERWRLKMLLQVPRVYDNTQSTGARRYQRQVLEGVMEVDQYATNREPIISVVALTNRTHKVGGECVTYDCTVDGYPLWHGIGSNRTGIFKTRSVVVPLVAEPSYAIGEEATEDNSLIVTLSGRGSENSLHGYVAGQLGCGCKEYGHVSPTRIWGTSAVVDTAATFGTFNARKIK